MINYSLEIIPGTGDYVKQELLTKFPEAEIIAEQANFVKFKSEINDVDEFRVLYSALRIAKQDGPVRNLFRRDWRKDYVPAGINPALAYVMCMIADLKPTDVVCDPFCGGGTIAISASVYFDVAKCLASDLSGKAVDITQLNFQAASIGSKKYTVFRSNVSQLKIPAAHVDKLITNLPFGVRTGDHSTNLAIYKAFANQCKRIVKPGGLIVILTQEKQLLLETFSDKSLELIKSFDVDQGGLKPRIFVYRRLNEYNSVMTKS